MKGRYYTYAHRFGSGPNEGEIFYIGKGTGDRAWATNESQRSNDHWQNTYKKYGRTVEILEDNLTEEKAFELEIGWISKLGRRDLGTGLLVNKTPGGEGGFYYDPEKLKVTTPLGEFETPEMAAIEHDMTYPALVLKLNSFSGDNLEFYYTWLGSNGYDFDNEKNLTPIQTPFGKFSSIKYACWSLGLTYSDTARKVRDKDISDWHYTTEDADEYISNEIFEDYNEESEQEDIEGKIDLGLILGSLSEQDRFLIYENVIMGRPEYAIASEIGSTKYLVRKRIGEVLNEIRISF